MAKNADKIENMSSEVRKATARDSVVKTTVLRILVAALLIFVIFYFELRGTAAAILTGAALLDLATMIPVWVIAGKELRDDEEAPAAEG